MTDIITLTEFDTESALYSKLKSIYQSEYEVGYSLIIEYDKDTFSNEKFPGKSLVYLVETLQKLDIPSFFVTIKTSKLDIKQDLSYFARKFQYTINNTILSDRPFQREVVKYDTFCSLPWYHLYFNQQGDILPCCQADRNYPLGNFINEKVNFNNDEIVSMRQSILNRERVPQCTFCYRLEDLGLTSPRQKVNNQNKNKLPINFYPVVKDFKLRHVDVRMSNVCNLKCRMCDSRFSSKIAEEDFKIWGVKQPVTLTDDAEQRMINLIKEQIHNVESVYFAGGEPLINDCHYEILDILIANNKHDTAISYNTNFSKLKYKNRSIIEYWKIFNNITVGASIDLIGEASNYVRNGISYEVLEENYQIIKQECPNVNFEITSTLSVYNLFNLCDLQSRWISVLGLSASNISFNILTSPDYLQFTILPTDIKVKATKKIKQHCDWLSTIPDSDDLIVSWQHVLRILSSENNEHLLSQFFKEGDIRDNHRNQNFEGYLQAYAELRLHIKS